MGGDHAKKGALRMRFLADAIVEFTPDPAARRADGRIPLLGAEFSESLGTQFLY